MNNIFLNSYTVIKTAKRDAATGILLPYVSLKDAGFKNLKDALKKARDVRKSHKLIREKMIGNPNIKASLADCGKLRKRTIVDFMEKSTNGKNIRHGTGIIAGDNRREIMLNSRPYEHVKDSYIGARKMGILESMTAAIDNKSRYKDSNRVQTILENTKSNTENLLKKMHRDANNSGNFYLGDNIANFMSAAGHSDNHSSYFIPEYWLNNSRGLPQATKDKYRGNLAALTSTDKVTNKKIRTYSDSDIEDMLNNRGVGTGWYSPKKLETRTGERRTVDGFKETLDFYFNNPAKTNYNDKKIPTSNMYAAKNGIKLKGQNENKYQKHEYGFDFTRRNPSTNAIDDSAYYPILTPRENKAYLKYRYPGYPDAYELVD